MLTESTFMPFEFLRPLWLLGIIAVVIFVLLGHIKAKKSKQQSLIAPHLSENLVTAAAQSKAKWLVLPLLGIIASIALAGPSWRSVEIPVYEMEKAQVLVLDMSYSMYATDLQPNRLSQAKYKAMDLINRWSEGEKALISYAGDAFTISPLTTDGNAIINHIPHLSPDIMPVRGSRADLALERAINLLKNAGYAQGHVVFISDAIDSQTSEKMIERLRGTPWIVSILALATEQGAAIKLADGSLLKNQQGEIIVPKLDEQPLYAISRATGGLYLSFTNSNADIEQLGSYFTLNKAHKSKGEQSVNNKFAKDDGYWLAFLLMPLFLLLFRKGIFYTCLLILTVQASSPDVEASIWKNDQQNAFQAYSEKDFAKAAQLYEEPLAKGSALYQNKQYQDALEQFTQAAFNNPSNAAAFYNQGNAYAQLREFDKAIQSYQQALALNPELKTAKENKMLIEQLKKQKAQQKHSRQQNNQQQAEQQNNEQQSSQQQSGQQNNEQQSSQQQSGQQNNEQQSSQQQAGQQNNKQQSSQQQQTGQQNNEQQSSQQQQSEQQNNEQQSNQQQQSEQQNNEQQSSQPAAQIENTEQNNQERENLPNWLKNMPDDPSLLLRNKMRLEYQKRAQSQAVKQQSNGDIW